MTSVNDSLMYQGNCNVPTWGRDTSGNVTGLVGPDGVVPFDVLGLTRPRFLVFGNSLQAINNTVLSGSTTTTSAEAKAGATVISVAAIGTIADGDKIAVAYYDGTILHTTVSGAPSGNNITLPTPLEKLVRSGANVLKYTGVLPTNVRRNGGPVYLGMAMLGMPVQFIQGYGYGGGTMPELVQDLPRVLEATKPKYAHLILPENSMALGSDELIRLLKVALRICAGHGVIALVNTCYPSDSYTAGAQAASYDAYNAYVRSQMLVDYPLSKCIDVGDQWLDTARPTLRAPLAGWTDGVHPTATKYAVIGTYYKEQFALLNINDVDMAINSITTNPYLAGTGGTQSGLQGGSISPSGYTITAQPGVNAATSVGPNGGLRIVMSVPGTSDITTTVLTMRMRLTMGSSAASGDQAMSGFVKLIITDLTGISMIYPYITYAASSLTYTCGQDAVYTGYAYLYGETVQLEAPALPIPTGDTYCDLYLYIRPQTGLSNGVSVDVEVLSAGLFPVPAISH